MKIEMKIKKPIIKTENVEDEIISKIKINDKKIISCIIDKKLIIHWVEWFVSTNISRIFSPIVDSLKIEKFLFKKFFTTIDVVFAFKDLLNIKLSLCMRIIIIFFTIKVPIIIKNDNKRKSLAFNCSKKFVTKDGNLSKKNPFFRYNDIKIGIMLIPIVSKNDATNKQKK